jgi:hypothetical protein
MLLRHYSSQGFLIEVTDMRLGIAFLSCAALLADTASAHHSFAMFDNQKDVTIEGTVKSFQWTNPHTWIQLMVKDANGNEAEWSIEGQSPNGLVRQGWQKLSLKAGDHAVVVIHPLKDGTTGGSVVRVTVNGELVGRPGGPPPPP